ncbi:hypothetical protein [Streptomyces sp. NPDC059076]|uniref:hypothetical protein n=1 Tax=unclassified Streptomyces TaxID=2593676 RepID=UPI0036B13206
MFHRLEAGDWPLGLVDEVSVFGSYARGAIEPGDLDIAITHRVDSDLADEVVGALSYGRDPMAVMKRALKGSRRGIQFQFNQNAALTENGIELTLLWKRGDSPARALERLDALRPDPAAGRAPRDHMIEPFEGLDRWIPLPVRAQLVELVDSGGVNIERLELTEGEPSHPDAVEMLEDRWSESSPLRRAAAAALHHAESSGYDMHTVWLQARTVAPWSQDFQGTLWIGLGWRYVSSLTHRLRQGEEWLEVVRPTRTQPLHALHITVHDAERLPRF